ncbi:unnamed protein product [Danaus chrysippus]|uniref:(African queen) hypothetical protein n=1 Tax=Danaus chrysippus TaxID=151541 RepID=A0A8J2W3P1_9NEOP|nr:unnamed protein product [Danaus chrysippus]
MQRQAGGASSAQSPRAVYRTHASHIYDIDDQIPASVISSVGTVSLSQSTTNPTSNTTMASRGNTVTSNNTQTQAPVRNLPKKKEIRSI